MDLNNWRMREMCNNCPFAKDGQGKILQESLRPARWKEITEGLLDGEHFFCHKTAEYSDEEEEDRDQGYMSKGQERTVSLRSGLVSCMQFSARLSPP